MVLLYNINIANLKIKMEEHRRKKCIFSCYTQKISFYPFLLPILYMFFRYCKDQIIEVSSPKNYKMLKYNLPYLFYLYLPKIFAIFIIPIIIYKTKGTEGDSNRATKIYHVISIQKNKRKMLLLICVISLLEVIQENGDLLLYYYERTGPVLWLVEKKTGV